RRADDSHRRLGRQDRPAGDHGEHAEEDSGRRAGGARGLRGPRADGPAGRIQRRVRALLAQNGKAMGSYRADAGALNRLVQADRVHRDVYTDAEVFQLEMERLWSRTWIYVGHASQVPNPGDFITLDIAAQPVIMVRLPDGRIRVLMNRCAHKGTKVVSDASGNAGKTF